MGTFVWSLLKKICWIFSCELMQINSTIKWIFNSVSKSVFVLLLGDGREYGGLGGVEGAGPAPVHLSVHLQRLGHGGHGDLLGHLVNHLLGVALDKDHQIRCLLDPTFTLSSPRWGCCTGRSRWAACPRWWSSQAGAGGRTGRGAAWRPGNTRGPPPSSAPCPGCCEARARQSWAQCGHLCNV